MWLEVSNKTLHATYVEGVAWLNDQLSGYYTANPGISQLHLTLPMLQPASGGHPGLKCKAAQCRHLSLFALFLAQRHRQIGFVLEEERLQPHSADYRRAVVECAVHIVGYHDSCSAEPFSVVRCQTSMLGFLEKFDELRLLFRRNLAPQLHAAQVFAPRPKFHMCEHLVCEKVELYGSPRLFWCYADEDFVGMIKRIAACTKNPRTLEAILMAKYRLYASLHAEALLAL